MLGHIDRKFFPWLRAQISLEGWCLTCPLDADTIPEIAYPCAMVTPPSC